jgi:hypothetical protein
MKKIKSIKDLQIEKMQLRITQLEQERKLKSNWNELKINLYAGVSTEKKLPDNKIKQTLKEELIAGAFGIGTGLISKKLSEIAGHRIESTVNKGLQKLFKKIKLKTPDNF